jgi:hypothetical protein
MGVTGGRSGRLAPLSGIRIHYGLFGLDVAPVLDLG